MIEIILTCVDCEVKSEPFQALSIDRYDYHDAPNGAVTLDNRPAGWWVDADNEFVLCPRHCTGERINVEQEKRWSERRAR